MFLEEPGFHFLRPTPPPPLLFDQPLILVLLLFCTSCLVQTGNGELTVVKHKDEFCITSTNTVTHIFMLKQVVASLRKSHSTLWVITTGIVIDHSYFLPNPSPSTWY